MNTSPSGKDVLMRAPRHRDPISIRLDQGAADKHDHLVRNVLRCCGALVAVLVAVLVVRAAIGAEPRPAAQHAILCPWCGGLVETNKDAR